MKTTITLSLSIKARQQLEDLSKQSGKFMSAVVEDLIEQAGKSAGESSQEIKDRECGNELVSSS